MADNQSVPASSVAPSDSASAPGRRSKPGKAERQARRSAVGSQPGQAASQAKAYTFATGVQTPKPQPGKFPVVFQTGAGEPARDQTFAIGPEELANTLGNFHTRFTHNAKYAEFKAHAEMDDDTFIQDLAVASLLRLAQQVVHSHVNLGLPLGDFSPVASTDVKIPASMAAWITQYGEYTVPALGTRFLLSGYEETVRALVWCAQLMNRAATPGPAHILHSWLPVSATDRRTKTLIADRLQQFLAGADVYIDPNALEAAVLSGQVPDAWEGLKGFFGQAPAEGEVDQRDRFDFLFLGYQDVPHFVAAFTSNAAAAVLQELGLPWTNPQAGHLDWGFNVKTTFTTLSDTWARKSATYAQFFELSSSQSNRSAAVGSQAQMAIVRTSDMVTIVKTHLALTAPEFSLVSCFPVTGVFTGDLARRVVVTTPLSVDQRATEFAQLDWR